MTDPHGIGKALAHLTGRLDVISERVDKLMAADMTECPQCRFVAYIGQDPPPWTPTALIVTEPPQRASKRELRRRLRELHEEVAWQRWKIEKIIHDFKLDQPRD